jgi:hypothetical protein
MAISCDFLAVSCAKILAFWTKRSISEIWMPLLEHN